MHKQSVTSCLYVMEKYIPMGNDNLNFFAFLLGSTFLSTSIENSKRLLIGNVKISLTRELRDLGIVMYRRTNSSW
jgi:hypothetical protein